MKNLLITIIFSLAFNIANAQLFGSGKVISRVFTYQGFDKLSIKDFDGRIEVEIGKPFEIKVEIDDNLEPRLRVYLDTKDNQLNIFLDGNPNGKLYLENTKIKIKVSMPTINYFEHRGNTVVVMKGIIGRYLKLNNSGNGNVFLSGQVDDLDIKKTGNGDVKADKLITNVAKVKSNGNGNVIVNSKISLEGYGTGNGSIMQAGQGEISALSSVIGNGEVRKL